jgi:hypothetical protein
MYIENDLGGHVTYTSKQQRLTRQKKSYQPELFGPGHFIGLGLRLKSEIRTRTRTRART